MIITVNIPDEINERLEEQKSRSGMSKSLLIRHILAAHFAKMEVDASITELRRNTGME